MIPLAEQAERAPIGVQREARDQHHANEALQLLSIIAARLEGSTLTVELRDTPIIEWSGLRRWEVGRVADRARRRYGEDLRALWRKISGDPGAVLDLGGGTER